jgi:magnesium transporter
VIIDRAIYRDGVRVAEPVDMSELADTCRAGGGIAWIGLYRPTHDEFEDVARDFGLHELAVEDAVHAHQRAKLERYGDTFFCVLRPARYVDERETVEFGEVHVFAGPSFIITVRHGEAPDLGQVRHDLEERSCTPSSIAWSTTTHPWSRGSRTTSTRSRTRSSAAASTSHAGSTS